MGPFIGFFPIKQSEEIPLSIRLGGGYSFLSFSGDAFDQFEGTGVEVDANGNTLSASAAIFHNVDVGETLQIIPFGEVGYVRQDVTVDASGFGESASESEDESTTYFGIGGSLLFQMSATSMFAVTPAILFSDGESNFSLSVALVLPQSCGMNLDGSKMEECI